MGVLSAGFTRCGVLARAGGAVLAAFTRWGVLARAGGAVLAVFTRCGVLALAGATVLALAACGEAARVFATVFALPLAGSAATLEGSAGRGPMCENEVRRKQPTEQVSQSVGASALKECETLLEIHRWLPERERPQGHLQGWRWRKEEQEDEEEEAVQRERK